MFNRQIQRLPHKVLRNFIKYLMELGVAHQIQLLAIAFSKERFDSLNVVQSADVTCIRLY